MHTAREEAMRLAKEGILNKNDNGVFDSDILSFFQKATHLRSFKKGAAATQGELIKLLVTLGFSTEKAREIIDAHLIAGTLLREITPLKSSADKEIYLTVLGSQLIKAAQER